MQVLDFVELNAVQRSALLREEVRGASAAQQQQVLSSWYASLDLGGVHQVSRNGSGGSSASDKAAAAAVRGLSVVMSSVSFPGRRGEA